MKTLIILFFGLVCSLSVFSKETKREPAARTKGIPNSVYSCSNAMADHGYVINVVTKKQKTTVNISESTFVGSRHIADLDCQRTRAGVAMADQIIQTLDCRSEKTPYKVEQFAGGFAGLITVDLFNGENQLADDVICQRL